MKFSPLPNCPQEGASLLIAQDCKVLNKLSFKYFIPTVKAPCLPPGLAFHADLQIHHLGGGLFLSAPEVYDYYAEKLSALGASVIKGKSRLSCNYPGDIAYNISRVGNKAFHNTRFTDSEAKNYFDKEKISLIHVNQGYTKCQTAISGKNSLITSDNGIHTAARLEKIAALLIEPGHILLPGYNYGFFGGCAALISKNKFFITGSIKNHPSGHKIYEFLEQQELEPVEAAKNAPIDIGSLIIA